MVMRMNTDNGTDDIWDDFFGSFDSFNERIEKLFSNFDDPEMKMYGYTMYQGPDGIPHVREFGNAVNEHRIASNNQFEPLTDISQEGNTVRVVVELPGVKKEDIQLEGSKDTVAIFVENSNKKFDRTFALPCNVDPETAKAEYNNGILEITLTAIDIKPAGRRIPIE
jgi:HSP20 family protein